MNRVAAKNKVIRLSKDVDGASDLDEILKPLTKKQQDLILTALRPENITLSKSKISVLAGYKRFAWKNALKDKRFNEALDKLGLRKSGPVYPSHDQVTLASDPLAEAEKDVWDLRRFYKDFPRHLGPGSFIVNFNEIQSLGLRKQVKEYFKSRLGVWRPRTFETEFDQIKQFCNMITSLFPTINRFSDLKREHIEKILLAMSTFSIEKRSKLIGHMRTMFDYMIETEFKDSPPRNIFWKQDIPKYPIKAPKPIPPFVRDQLDQFLEEVVKRLNSGDNPPFFDDPSVWDALIVLRYTGRRIEDLAHLQWDCLRFDSDGDPYIFLDHRISKTSADLTIPISHLGSTVVNAIRRQQERVKDLPPINDIKYLFIRKSKKNGWDVITKQFISKDVLRVVCEKIPLVDYDGAIYYISPHQFRHTVATEMIDAGVDIYAVKEFLGHASLRMTERYIKVYQETVKRELQRRMPGLASKEIATTFNKADAPYTGKWVKGKIAVFRNGEGGWCEHPFKMPACPKKPVCRTCVKFKSDTSYLPVYEKDIENYQELYNRALEMGLTAKASEYKKDLDIAKRIRDKLLADGFWDGSKDLYQ